MLDISNMNVFMSTAEHLSQQCGALSHRMRKFEPPVAELYTKPQFKVHFIPLFRAMGKLKWLDIEPLQAWFLRQRTSLTHAGSAKRGYHARCSI